MDCLFDLAVEQVGVLEQLHDVLGFHLKDHAGDLPSSLRVADVNCWVDALTELLFRGSVGRSR